ncbi:MAG: hypothetical protein NTZ09_15185 [Candidatus Hydrogenedentes bacterium]|nr:hypothetical protein [Candidatus Hydrogenedentota bacterium]
MLAILTVLCLCLTCCPQHKEVDPCQGGPAGPFSLSDYFPMAEGNSWTWRLYLSDEPGDEVSVDFSLTIDEAVVSGEYEVCHGTLDAPWYILLGLSWLFGGGDSGYLTSVDGLLYYGRDGAGAEARIAALPALEGWKVVPLHSDLSPRMVETESDGKPLFIQYCGGYFPDSVLDSVRLDLLPAEFYPTEPIVILHTSKDGYDWSRNKMVLGRGTGLLFGKTSFGRFYLRSATVIASR